MRSVDLALEARGLRVEVGPAHARRDVVRDVSVLLRPGEITALVGETGSGKTMTALSVLRLLPQGATGEAATLRLRDIDLRELSENDMARVRGNRISMIFQDPLAALNPVRTVGFQIAEPLRTHRHLGARAAKQRAIELLDQVGIPDPAHNVGRYAHELSGGMRQRVLIAAALACDPEILIADEPTTALDVTIQAQILRLIRTETERRGLAVLLVTHDLAVASTIADRIEVMYGGTIVERGKARDVIERPNHPYTRGLLDSVPTVLQKLTPLRAIPGSPEGVAAMSRGCRFAPRCPHAIDRCAAIEPPLVSVGPDHDSRCWVFAPPAEAS
ncbi:MAG TPA: ABC transporter ATP-binding protein [Candidatus Limnocylindria bacterium]|jgi:oligopeptide/dipeptide ABC transporter ATP-binding protein|nr:ABC transporter ATP-binding protein [Candidatus Limnocylindria bacterium]